MWATKQFLSCTVRQPETFAKPTFKLTQGRISYPPLSQFIDKNKNCGKSQQGRYEISPYKPSFAKISA
ncbi:hypothetical protein [Alysiella filiformis]|uniref:hypothetical protein n=1 Tax=Alysiella filiformis TaxID=194196 RepID=UPI000BE43CF8|nr:hypothetical protein [Alysiella filiformis]QMT31805.1 hypothetical protein H3L97_02650 [Alysiella filiformis]UBQ55181.1 hypothetical protein JF568_06030 [Alysiella filiformis DSM 16848]